MNKTNIELFKDNLKELFKNSINIDDYISNLVNLLCTIEEFINYLDDLYDKKEIELKFYRNLKKEFLEDE